MRFQNHLEEHHLVEAARRNLITEEQREGILAIARSARMAYTGSVPTFEWVNALYTAVAIGAESVAGLMTMAKLCHFKPVEFVCGAAFGALGSMAAGAIAARFHARSASAILIGFSAAWMWGIGAGLALQVQGVSACDVEWRGGNSFLETFGAGFGTMLAGSLAIGYFRRIAFAAVPVIAALVGIACSLLRWSDVGAPSLTLALVGVLGSISWLALTRWTEQRWRGESDPAFWFHLAGLLMLGVSFMVGADVPGKPWGVVAVADATSVVALMLGVRWSRVVYLLLGSLGVLVFTPWTLSLLSARFGSGTDDLAIWVGLAAAAIAILSGATWLRQNASRVWHPVDGAITDSNVFG